MGDFNPLQCLSMASARERPNEHDVQLWNLSPNPLHHWADLYRENYIIDSNAAQNPSKFIRRRAWAVEKCRELKNVCLTSLKQLYFMFWFFNFFVVLCCQGLLIPCSFFYIFQVTAGQFERKYGVQEVFSSTDERNSSCAHSLGASVESNFTYRVPLDKKVCSRFSKTTNTRTISHTLLVPFAWMSGHI